MPDAEVDRKEFSTKCTVFLLCILKLSTEEGEWLPDTIDSQIEHCTYCLVGSVRCQSNFSSDSRGVQNCCICQRRFCFGEGSLDLGLAILLVAIQRTLRRRVIS